jgi:DNA-binding MarR family transcriptional regulator
LCIACNSATPKKRGQAVQPKDIRPVAHPRAIYYLNQANHAVRSRLEAALAALEMTGIQYTVLSVIGNREGLSSAQLSRRFFVTPQTMNELIAGLHRRGYIERTEDQANRRILRMRLTKAGARLVSDCDKVADRIEREVFGFLSDKDYDALRSLTQRIAAHLRG